MISVALLHANRVLRDHLASVLPEYADIQVVYSGSSLTHGLRSARPDVLLFDARFADVDLGGQLRIARAMFPAARLIVMDIRVNRDATELFNHGADACLASEASVGDVADALRGASMVGRPLGSRMRDDVRAESRDNRVPPLGDRGARDTRLTLRECQIVDLIRAGKTTKELANELGISWHTVRCHVRNVMEKLHVHSRIQLAVGENASTLAAQVERVSELA